MSVEMKESSMEVDEPVVEAILDEFQIAYDEIEEKESELPRDSIINKYLELLKNDRLDESAVKIKENILYK